MTWRGVAMQDGGDQLGEVRVVVPMSARLVRAILEDGPADAFARLVLVVLADHADAQGFARPSVERIAERAALSVSSARRALRRLEQERWILRLAGGGRKRANGYRIVRPAPKPGQSDTLSGGKPGQSDTLSGGKPGQSDTLSAQNPVSLTAEVESLYTNTHHTDGPTCARAGAREAGSPPFQAFVDLWPGPLQADRAERAWMALDPAQRSEALAAIASGWVERWRARQSSTVAMIGGGTFLEGRRWREHGRAVPADAGAVDAQLAEVIRAGKRHLLGNVSAARGRELVARGLVTRADLARVGLE